MSLLHTGVDDEYVYTKKDAKKVKGNSKLREHVTMPKNFCAVLAEETDGSIFDIQKWRDVKPVLGDKFEDVLTNVVAKKGAPTTCQKCDCVPDQTGVGMAICRDCSYGVGNVSMKTESFVVKFKSEQAVSRTPFETLYENGVDRDDAHYFGYDPV